MPFADGSTTTQSDADPASPETEAEALGTEALEAGLSPLRNISAELEASLLEAKEKIPGSLRIASERC